MRTLDNAIIGLSNLAVKGRRTRVKGRELLLLFSSCLQDSRCEQRITTDLSRCQRCGRCEVKDLLEIAEQFGVQVAVATGGELAMQKATDNSVKVVVAVACEKELREGVLGCFPKPVWAVAIERPNGPCHDTIVDLEVVRQAMRWLLRE